MACCLLCESTRAEVIDTVPTTTEKWCSADPKPRTQILALLASGAVLVRERRVRCPDCKATYPEFVLAGAPTQKAHVRSDSRIRNQN